MSSHRPMAALRFWTLTMGLLLVWFIVFATAAATITTPVTTATLKPTTSKATKDNKETQKEAALALERQNTKNCKSLCAQCGCLGFYCGEECICEYNKRKGASKNDNTDTECIERIQRDAFKLRIPFEMLIQGPSNNRFVRNAWQFNQNATNHSAAISNRNPRSTVVIYKPVRSYNELLQPIDSLKASTKAKAVRDKRSIAQLDWFSDLANTLRPAPLGKSGSPNRKREIARSEEEQHNSQGHGHGVEKLESWFTDHANKLVRPSPLFRRQATSAASSEAEESAEPAMLGKVIKDTFRQFRDSDLGETLRSRIKDSADILHNSLDAGNLNLFPQEMRDQLVETLLNMQQQLQAEKKQTPPATTAPPPAVTPETASQFIIPWFRPMRFLQRVQQALT